MHAVPECIVPQVSADDRGAAAALLLVDEGLLADIADPVRLLCHLVRALSLCSQIGDIARAKRYEQMAHKLLTDHTRHPGVQGGLFRLHSHLGAFARHRKEYPMAYWHFMAGAKQIAEQGTDDQTDPSAWLFWFHVQIGATCEEMDRLTESLAALDRAQTFIRSGHDHRTWLISRAALHWHMGHFREALANLALCETASTSQWLAETRVHWLLVKAVVHRDIDDGPEFKASLDRALQLAVEHRLDGVLPRIQRLLRGPQSHERQGQ